jgi:hypothetical protein
MCTCPCLLSGSTHALHACNPTRVVCTLQHTHHPFLCGACLPSCLVRSQRVPCRPAILWLCDLNHACREPPSMMLHHPGACYPVCPPAHAPALAIGWAAFSVCAVAVGPCGVDLYHAQLLKLPAVMEFSSSLMRHHQHCAVVAVCPCGVAVYYTHSFKATCSYGVPFEPHAPPPALLVNGGCLPCGIAHWDAWWWWWQQLLGPDTRARPRAQACGCCRTPECRSRSEKHMRASE